MSASMQPATHTTGRGFRTHPQRPRDYCDRPVFHGAQYRAVKCEFMGIEPMESCTSIELANREHTSSRLLRTEA